jgi:lipopolysaccharide export system ATP-binding protein
MNRIRVDRSDPDQQQDLPLPVEAKAFPEGLPGGDGAMANGAAGVTPAPQGRAADGHSLISVNGTEVDPRTIEGLVGYHLGKAYRGRPVVRDVSIGVQRGEVVGLLGPNGAGKTTCFYVMTGLIRADAGAIYLDGEEVTDLPMYQRARGGIGYLPQEASVFRGMSVEDNIMTVLEVTERERAKRQPLLDRLLAEFSIEHLRRVPALALSGGERRRVEIARCVATRPNYILLDEPLAGIDPIAVGDIRDIVTHLKDRGIGVLITDHNVRDTLEIVDRAYILHEGRVLKEGAPPEIVDDPQVRRVYLGERFSL